MQSQHRVATVRRPQRSLAFRLVWGLVYVLMWVQVGWTFTLWEIGDRSKRWGWVARVPVVLYALGWLALFGVWLYHLSGNVSPYYYYHRPLLPFPVK